MFTIALSRHLGACFLLLTSRVRRPLRQPSMVFGRIYECLGLKALHALPLIYEDTLFYFLSFWSIPLPFLRIEKFALYKRNYKDSILSCSLFLRVSVLIRFIRYESVDTWALDDCVQIFQLKWVLTKWFRHCGTVDWAELLSLNNGQWNYYYCWGGFAMYVLSQLNIPPCQKVIGF